MVNSLFFNARIRVQYSIVMEIDRIVIDVYVPKRTKHKLLKN